MPKEKISITIEKQFVEWINEQVKAYRFRNRSHAIEYAIVKLVESEKEGVKP